MSGILVNQPTVHLNLGYDLYHGTDDKSRRQFRPKWPTFFTTSPGAAAIWASEHARKKPTVYWFEVDRRVEVFDFFDYEEMTNTLVAGLNELSGRHISEDREESYHPTEIADELCKRGFAGWRISNAEFGSDEIVICQPHRMLAYRGKLAARRR